MISVLLTAQRKQQQIPQLFMYNTYVEDRHILEKEAWYRTAGGSS